MKTLQLHTATIDLPDCWEDLTFKEKTFTFGVLDDLFTGQVTPLIARLKLLIEYTGYKPDLKALFHETYIGDVEQRELINFNLLKLSEELNFAFTVDDGRILPGNRFKCNPIPYIRIGPEVFTGRIFDIDATCRTNITAREFSDCFDALTALNGASEADHYLINNQICAILYPMHGDYYKNISSGHHWKMRNISRNIKYGVTYWFTGIVQYYTGHPVYGLLFKGATGAAGEDKPGKIHLGMNDITLTLKKEGYGDPEHMNLNDYFDAQIKYLRETVQKAVAQGAKKGEIASKTGIPLDVVNKLA